MSPEPILVGLTVSVSGRFRQQGEQVLHGVEEWRKWVNNHGGIRVGGVRRRLVEVVSYDDESQVSLVERYTDRLINRDGVDVLFGPYSSGLTVTAARIASGNRMTLWNHSGATDTLYDTGYRNVVSILSPASRYFHGFLELIDEHASSQKRLAILRSQRGSFAGAVASGAESKAAELGMTVVLNNAWKAPLSDASVLISQVEATRPELIVGVGDFEEDLTLIQALVNSRIEAEAVGVVAAGVTEFGDRLGSQATGVFGPTQWEPIPRIEPGYGPASDEVIERLRKGGRPPDYPAAQAFATGLIVQRCLQNLPVTDRPIRSHQGALRSIASELSMKTFYGQFEIDEETGCQIGHAPAIVQWIADRKQVVWPPDLQQITPRYPTHVDAR